MNIRVARLIVFSGVSALAVFGQAQPAAAKLPRTADGHPKLEGIWTNATLTPLQRPPELASKPYFTEEEAAAYVKQRVAQSRNADRPEARKPGDPGSYNQAFFDSGERIVKTRRTSLVIDPADGRIPPYTPEAQARLEKIRAHAALHPADGPEDRDLSERCLMFSGVGPPMLAEPYNNNYQIVQSPGYVAILAEMNHDTRVIPTSNQPTSNQPTPGQAGAVPKVVQWHGNSRGHWEGDTLVVETGGIRFNDQSHFGVAYRGMSDENLRVVERFMLSDPDTIMYRATVEDRTVYSKPWTIEIPMTRSKGPVFEYACNEGNYGMLGILEGERVQEKAAAKK
jgi:hypothetical protein